MTWLELLKAAKPELDADRVKLSSCPDSHFEEACCICEDVGFSCSQCWNGEADPEIVRKYLPENN